MVKRKDQIVLSIRIPEQTREALRKLSDQINEMDSRIQMNIGSERYSEAREYLNKAKILMEQSAYDMASDFLDKAGSALNS